MCLRACVHVCAPCCTYGEVPVLHLWFSLHHASSHCQKEQERGSATQQSLENETRKCHELTELLKQANEVGCHASLMRLGLAVVGNTMSRKLLEPGQTRRKLSGFTLFALVH